MREQLQTLDDRYARRSEILEQREEVRQIADSIERIQIGRHDVPFAIPGVAEGPYPCQQQSQGLRWCMCRQSILRFPSTRCIVTGSGLMAQCRTKHLTMDSTAGKDRLAATEVTSSKPSFTLKLASQPTPQAQDPEMTCQSPRWIYTPLVVYTIGAQQSHTWPRLSTRTRSSITSRPIDDIGWETSPLLMVVKTVKGLVGGSATSGTPWRIFCSQVQH